MKNYNKMAIDLQLMSFNGTNITSSAKNNFSVLTGNSVLAQRVLKLLLTVIGSDYYNTDMGSDILSLYGNYPSGQLDKVKSLIVSLIKSLKEQILSDQIKDELNGIIYSQSELLSDIVVDSVIFEKEYTGWRIILQVISKQGDSVIIQTP